MSKQFSLVRDELITAQRYRQAFAQLVKPIDANMVPQSLNVGVVKRVGRVAQKWGHFFEGFAEPQALHCAYREQRVVPGLTSVPKEFQIGSFPKDEIGKPPADYILSINSSRSPLSFENDVFGTSFASQHSGGRK